MTIKKPIKKSTVTAIAKPKPRDGEEAAAETPAATGGNVTLSDRFKLDAPDPDAAKKAAAAGKGTKAALIAGVIALAVVGILTYTLWKHWEFLMPA